MTQNEKFDVIILIGRPAAGKSEVIDFLKKTSDKDRINKFHIAPFEEIDDFIYVWEKFEEDEIFVKHNKPRVFTDNKWFFLDNFMWNFFIEKINLAYMKKLNKDTEFNKRTIIIEFSRGGQNAFKEAFETLDNEILKRAAIMYIKVSYQESVRKNRRRFKPQEADSVLYHSLPDEKMEFYYKTNDWDQIAPDLDGYIEIKGHKIPYAALPNEPEVTDTPEKLSPALNDAFSRLWKRYINK